MVIKELLRLGEHTSARQILAHVLNKPKDYLLMYENEEISKEQEEQFLSLLEKRKLGYPLQYILGKQEFMKLNFTITEDVLIPRTDTEILVEEVMKLSKEIEKDKITILDLCTGSGCITISLAKYVENAYITAVDISKKALEVAQLNARNMGVVEKIDLYNFDVLKENNLTNKFDIIVSNPPYIRQDILKTLQTEVQHEPQIALNGGEMGLIFYEEITKNFSRNLNEKGYLCFEIGYDQKDDVINILKNQKYKNIYCKKDLSNNDRVVVGRRP